MAAYLTFASAGGPLMVRPAGRFCYCFLVGMSTDRSSAYRLTC